MITRTSIALCLVAPLAGAQVTVYEYQGKAIADAAGTAVARAGDVDGDGWPDVAVGIPGSDLAGLGAGQVEVISGRDGSIILSVYGASPGDGFGYSIDGLGDIDGDGLDDLVVGSPWAVVGGVPTGMVSVLLGTGQVLGTLSVPGLFNQCGQSVAGTGDVDGDGIGDFVFGAPFYDGIAVNCGRFDVVSGATLQTIYWIEGHQTSEQLGYSVDSAGDMNGNGRAEVVVGAPGYNKVLPPQNDVGRVSVWSYVPFTGALLSSHLGSSDGDMLGISVAGLGDVTGDGVPDFAAGAPSASVNGAFSGQVRVFSGAAPYAAIWSQNGLAGWHLGHAIAGLGDMDGDGLGELGVSAPRFGTTNATEIGRTQAIAPLNGLVLHTWYGASAYEQLGRALSPAGDLNHDGFADVVMGAPYFSGPGISSGLAVVALGQAPVPLAYCTAKQNSAGCTPTITSSGAPSTSISDTFHVSASMILNNVPGMLIWSRSPGSLPVGGGTLCVAPPVRRTPGQLSGAAAGTACGGGFDFHVSHAFLAAHSLTAGTTMYAQYWSRDPGFAAPYNMSFTDGLEITLVP